MCGKPGEEVGQNLARLDLPELGFGRKFVPPAPFDAAEAKLRVKRRNWLHFRPNLSLARPNRAEFCKTAPRISGPPSDQPLAELPQSWPPNVPPPPAAAAAAGRPRVRSAGALCRLPAPRPRRSATLRGNLRLRGARDLPGRSGACARVCARLCRAPARAVRAVRPLQGRPACLRHVRLFPPPLRACAPRHAPSLPRSGACTPEAPRDFPRER